MRTLALALLMSSASTVALAQAEPATTPEQIAETMARHVGHGTPSNSGIDAQPVQIPSPAMPTDLTPAGVAAADPYIWLEDVDGERAMARVTEFNADARATLDADPRFEPFRQEAYAILSATDRIAMPHMQDGMVYNFWQDDEHPKGIWRRATPESYRSGAPQWETVLDIDALAAAEDRDWVWKGATCYGPDESMCLISLSDGGGDAVEVREYDTEEMAWVSPGEDGGFYLPMGKHRFDWLDTTTLLVATDFGEVDGQPSLTESGYPYIVRALTRGQSLAEARTVFAGQQGDGGYGVNPSVYRGPAGEVEAVIITRPLDTFRSQTWALIDGESVQLNLPERVTIWGTINTAFGGDITVVGESPYALVFTLDEAWRTDASTLSEGALVAANLSSLAGTGPGMRQAFFEPSARQSVTDVAISGNRVIVSLLDNVRGQIRAYQFHRGRDTSSWGFRPLDVPNNASVTLVDASRSSDEVYYSVEGFLTPTTLYAADASTGESQIVASMPARFDASGAVVEQFEVASSDGTMIPYFLVRPRDLPMDGSTGTILHGYGGFQISKPADYIPEMGALWLENGGAFVIANIRGGGEFGPVWHQAALRENRQRAFDDFYAVAEDLIRRGITSPEHLGIYGRSNGGVLTSVAVTQRPDLFNAAVIESPLIDMLRYHELPAGASWIGEYGDPRVPGDAAFIAAYSGYQNARPGVEDFPRVYITTNTHDDRVHPGHARKFAARLEEYGYDPIYFEDTAGGHSYDADPAANARRWARHYVYFSQQLMD